MAETRLDYMVAATTLHSADIIGRFLERAERVGAEHALILDLGSKDGTQDLVRSSRWHGFASLIQVDDYRADDSSNTLLQHAKSQNSVTWCLFCDPDEMIPIGLVSLAPAEDISCIQIARRNVTARRSHLTKSLDAPWDALTLEIGKPVKRTSGARLATVLDPPWIYSFIKSKILVRLTDTEAIGSGDHIATLGKGRVVKGANVVLHHYPLRSYDAFTTKIESAKSYLAANPQFGEDWGWHWRRWVRLAEEGALEAEYLSQFPDDETAAIQISDGTLTKIAPL
jgi:hypothetical protein